MNMSCNTAAIFQLIQAAFNKEEFISFCSDNLHQVQTASLSDLGFLLQIQQVLETYEKQDNLSNLLNLVKDHKPQQYSRFEAAIFPSETETPHPATVSLEEKTVLDIALASSLSDIPAAQKLSLIPTLINALMNAFNIADSELSLLNIQLQATVLQVETSRQVGDRLLAFAHADDPILHALNIETITPFIASSRRTINNLSNIDSLDDTLSKAQERHAKELALVNEINHTLLASVDLEITIDAVLRSIQTLLDYTAAEMNIWDKDRQIFNAIPVGDTRYTAEAGGYYTRDEGFTGWIFKKRIPLFVPNIDTDTVSGAIPKSTFPFKSYIGLPLMVEDDFIGTLELAHLQPNSYTFEDLESLKTIANQAAVAIKHALLFQQSEQHALSQEQLAEIAALASTTLDLEILLQRIMQKTVTALGAEMGVVYLLNDDETKLAAHPASAIGLKAGVDIGFFQIPTDAPDFHLTPLNTGEIFVSDHVKDDKRVLPLYKPLVEAANVEKVLIVPLKTAERNVGEIHIVNRPTAFNQYDINFLSAVAVHFTVAIQNASLFGTIQRNLAELSILYQSTADLSSTLAAEELLSNLANRMISMLPVDRCIISLYDPLTKNLRVVYQNQLDGPVPDQPKVMAASSRPIISKVLQNQRSQIVNTIDPDLDDASRAWLQTSDSKALLLLPLIVRNESFGLIELYTQETVAYHKDEIDLAQALANQAAIALQNAQLYQETDEQLKQRIQQLSGLQRVSRQLNSTLVLDTIIRLVMEEAVRATGADFGNISLYHPETNQLETRIHEGWPEDLSDNQVDMVIEATGIMGRVLFNNTAEIINDVSKDANYIPYPIPAESEMVVPIRYADTAEGIYADTAEGIINLESFSRNAFTLDQLQHVEALADQAAIAIRNSQEYAALEEERRQASTRINQLARVSEINRAFRANLQLESILEEIAFAIQETVGFAFVLIGTVERDALRYVTGAGIPITQLNSLKENAIPIEAINTAFRPEFQISDSFFIPAVQRHSLNKQLGVSPEDLSYGEGQTDGNWRYDMSLLTPLRDTEGDLTGLLAVDALDENQRPSEQLVTVLEIFANQAATAIENAYLFQEVQHRVAQLKLFSEISSHISAILNPAELLSEVVSLIANAFDYYFVQILQVDQVEPGLLVSKNGAGIAVKKQSFVIPEGHIPINDDSITGWVAHHRKPLMVNDVTQEPRYLTDPKLPDTLSEIALPLEIGQNILGVLDIQHHKLGAFTADDMNNLQTLAGQLAVAIQNAQLFDEAIQRERLSSALGNTGLMLNETLDPSQILDLICREATAAFYVDSAFLWMVEGNYIRGAAAAGKNREAFIGQMVHLSEKEVLGVRIIHQRRGEILNEADFNQDKISFPLAEKFNARSILGTPLIAGDRTIGALMLLDSQNPNRFDTQDQISVTLLANQAAIAIENAHLFEQEQRRVVELNILNQTGQAINATSDLETLVQVIYEQLSELMDANNMFIALYHSETNMITFPLGKGGPNEQWEPRVAGSGITEYIIRNKQPLLLNGDIRKQLAAMGVERIGQTTKSWMGVPMLTGSHVLGVIAIQNYEDGNAYSENDLNVLSTIAAQAAIALQNIYLLNDTKVHADEMHRLYELGVLISQDFDLAQILQQVIHEALALTGMHLATIQVWDEETETFITEVATTTSDDVTAHIQEHLQADTWREEILDRGMPLIINDAVNDLHVTDAIKKAGVVASIGIPIKASEETIGTLFVHSQVEHRFDSHDLDLLQFLATQASATITSARLVHRLNKLTEELEERVEERTEALEQTLKKLRQERDRVDILYNIARQLSASLDLGRVLNEALHLLDRVLEITQGSILLIDPATGNLVYRAAIGRKKPLPRGGVTTNYRIGVGLAGQVLETRKPTIVKDLEENEYWIEDGQGPKHRSVLAVPLITAYEVLGILMLFHSEPDYFSEDHLTLVTAAAPMIATAINNADLYTLITEQSERVGTLLRTVQAEASKNEAIVAGIADGVLVIDAKSKIQLVNPATARILGTTQEALKDQFLDTILNLARTHVDELLAQELHTVITSQQDDIRNNNTTVTSRIDVHEKAVMINLSSITLTSNANALPSTLVVLRDISREAEIDRMKDEFISTVSHELRTPMTSIKGYTDLLVANKVGELTDTQRRFVETIKANADRLADLVNDILEISQLDVEKIKLDLQSIDVQALVNQILPSFNPQLDEKELSLTLNVADDLPTGYADAKRVSQVLVNLIGNATKYTKAKDKIFIDISYTDQFIRISVQDTGFGISPEDQKRVFERFFRAERDAASLVDGTGLGLPIAKMFVEMMGGEIWVESELGVGSTFRFTIPCETESDEPVKDIELSQTQQPILVVDDDKDIVTLLQQQLESAGYEVITVLKSAEVLSKAKAYQPSLITLDLKLDDGDGFEILEQLKADPETKDIPVVIASVLSNLRTKSLALGAADYVVKPFDQDQVLDTIRGLIDVVSVHKANGKLKKVLVADDDREIVTWLENALTDQDFSVTGVYTGEEALESVKANHPDLILLDLEMPGMDGFEVIDHLRAEPETANIPVIVITGSSINKKRDKIKMLGLDSGHLITKPFSLDELVSEIKKIEQPNPSQDPVMKKASIDENA